MKILKFFFNLCNIYLCISITVHNSTIPLPRKYFPVKQYYCDCISSFLRNHPNLKKKIKPHSGPFLFRVKKKNELKCQENSDFSFNKKLKPDSAKIRAKGSTLGFTGSKVGFII